MTRVQSNAGMVRCTQRLVPLGTLILLLYATAGASAQSLHVIQNSHSNRIPPEQPPSVAQNRAPLADDRRLKVVSTDDRRAGSPPSPPATAVAPEPIPRDPPANRSGSTPVDLPTALEWTLSYQPGLIAVRQDLGVSAEAIEVARKFPTSINPTFSVDVRPWVVEPLPGGGSHPLQTLVGLGWSQPIEWGHRRGYRESMARATYSLTRWNILQAELTALVQTYRLHQTALYRRQKFEQAEKLVAFNRHLLDVLRRRVEANQAPAADLVLAEVESQSTIQQRDTARQEYLTAVMDLREQIGVPEEAASLEPVGDLRLPEASAAGGEESLIRMALEARPEIRTAQAQAANSRAAVCLARAERIPITNVGPAYEKDETGTSFYGFVVSTPIPVLNAGRTLVAQREAEHRRDCVALEQSRRRVVVQVKATLTRWDQVRDLAARVEERMQPIEAQTARMGRLYDAGQTDLVKLLQVRQRAIEAEYARLDAVWQATQAYADLLTALGSTPLVGSLPE